MASASRPASHRRRRLATLGIVGTIFLMIALGVATAVSYRKFTAAAAVPTPPDDPGSVFLFFDKPGVLATLQAEIADYGPGSTGLDYRVTVDRRYTGDNVRFYLDE